MSNLEDKIRVMKSDALYGKEIATLFEPPTLVAKRSVLNAVVDVQNALDATYENAKNAGLAEAQNEATEMLITARKEYENARKNAEDDAIDFAFALAAKIIGHEVIREPKTILGIVTQLLNNVRDRRALVILVNPEDLTALDQHRDQLTAIVGGVPIHFETRSDLTRGGCVIETATGRIDGKLETQLRMLRDAMESA